MYVLMANTMKSFGRDSPSGIINNDEHLAFQMTSTGALEKNAYIRIS